MTLPIAGGATPRLDFFELAKDITNSYRAGMEANNDIRTGTEVRLRQQVAELEHALAVEKAQRSFLEIDKASLLRLLERALPAVKTCKTAFLHMEFLSLEIEQALRNAGKPTNNQQQGD